MTLLSVLVACGAALTEPVPSAPAAPTAPALSGATVSISLKTIVGLEAATQSGYERVQPPVDRPLAIAAGDRLWIQAFTDDSLWVYGVAAQDQAHWWPAFVSAPGSQAAPGERFPMPTGWPLSEQDAQMDTLYVVASLAPIPWLEGLSSTHCPDIKGSPEPQSPSSLCEQVYGLIWQVPPRIRGAHRLPTPELIRKRGVVSVFGNIAEGTGRDVVALGTPFKQH